MIGVPLASRTIADLAARHGGELRNGVKGTIRRLVPIARASTGDLTVLLNVRYLDEAVRAQARGAVILVDEPLALRVHELPMWTHPNAAFALAEVLDTADAVPSDPVIGAGARIGPMGYMYPRVTIGERVSIGAGTVIGAPGFGFVTDPAGKAREIPQLGGVIIEDDVSIGPLCTIAAGTLGPTIIRRGAKLDAQVHVGHNCDIGEGTLIAAQSGIAGSVTIGRNVLIGGQVGIADHLVIGERARIAAKSGVIGDVEVGATIAGYPAVERHRWLRGLAELYRLASGGSSSLPPPPMPPTTPTSPPPAVG